MILNNLHGGLIVFICLCNISPNTYIVRQAHLFLYISTSKCFTKIFTSLLEYAHYTKLICMVVTSSELVFQETNERYLKHVKYMFMQCYRTWLKADFFFSLASRCSNIGLNNLQNMSTNQICCLQIWHSWLHSWPLSNTFILSNESRDCELD